MGKKKVVVGEAKAEEVKSQPTPVTVAGASVLDSLNLTVEKKPEAKKAAKSHVPQVEVKDPESIKNIETYLLATVELNAAKQNIERIGERLDTLGGDELKKVEQERSSYEKTVCLNNSINYTTGRLEIHPLVEATLEGPKSVTDQIAGLRVIFGTDFDKYAVIDRTTKRLALKEEKTDTATIAFLQTKLGSDKFAEIFSVIGGEETVSLKREKIGGEEVTVLCRDRALNKDVHKKVDEALGKKLLRFWNASLKCLTNALADAGQKKLREQVIIEQYRSANAAPAVAVSQASKAS